MTDEEPESAEAVPAFLPHICPVVETALKNDHVALLTALCGFPWPVK